MTFKNKKLLFTIITFTWVCVIFSFSLQTGEASSEVSGSLVEKLIALFMSNAQIAAEQIAFLEHVLRKCAHFTEFLVLGILSSITLGYWQLRHEAWCAFGFCVAVAVIDETLQLFISGRCGNVKDVMIDSVGAVVGIVILFPILQKRLLLRIINRSVRFGRTAHTAVEDKTDNCKYDT